MTVQIVKCEGIAFAEKGVIKPFVSARVFGCVLTTPAKTTRTTNFFTKM